MVEMRGNGIGTSTEIEVVREVEFITEELKKKLNKSDKYKQMNGPTARAISIL